mmetsp:Transcript_13015/g.17118  ORF Transcript_13015/g.17118 Transcript_13015/m.17118 type:complete len:328 (-) Transcript_13015:19-1002(-)
MLLLALGSIFVESLTHFGYFGFLFFCVFVLIVIVFIFIGVLVFFLNNQARDAIVGIVGLLEESMGELHTGIFSSKVVIDVFTRVKNSAIFILEDTDLDLGSTAGADGTAVVSSSTIILRVVNHFTIKEVSGLHVTIVFHILDLVALVHAGVAVHLELTGEFLEFTFFIVLFFLVVSLAVFLTSVAHFLLKLGFVLNDGLKIGVEVNHVFTVIVSASSTGVGGTKTEDNETLSQENSAGIFLVCHLVTVGLDELTLLELDGVLSNIGDVFFFFIKFTTQLRVFCGLGTTHQFVHVLALGISRAGRCERVGSSDGSRQKEGSKCSDLHG